MPTVTDDPTPRRPLVVGITGASGAAYGLRLIDVLLTLGRDVHLAISDSGRAVVAHELKRPLPARGFSAADLLGFDPSRRSVTPDHSPMGRLSLHAADDMMAPIASGSFLTHGMVICPASGGTMASVAHGGSDNLIERAADVHLKERRPLILVPRETPLSQVHLRNYLTCAKVGAVVLPAAPGFYGPETTVETMIDFIVARILDQLGIEHDLLPRWGQPRPAS